MVDRSNPGKCGSRMGNFYVNFAVKNAEPQKVADSLKGRRAIVTPSQAGFVVVYDEQADTQAVDAIQEVGALLSKDPGEPVLAVLNHDDDILCYWLFKEGALIDAYNSAPDSFRRGGGGIRRRRGAALRHARGRFGRRSRGVATERRCFRGRSPHEVGRSIEASGLLHRARLRLCPTR